jgi:putative phage-type endonuclease
MTAILIPTASETEWLAARRLGVAASEIACVMGLAPAEWDSPYSLYHRKLGNLPPLEETDAMALGRHMEPFVAARFAERHPALTLTGSGRDLFTNPDRPWQMATPDRLVCDCPGADNAGAVPCVQPLAVLECKIDGGSDEWGDDDTDQVPVHYRCQLLQQMDVMSVAIGYLAAFLWHRRQIRVYELHMDDQAQADLDILRREAWQFYNRLIEHREPDIDWRPATARALRHLHPGIEDRDVEISQTLAGQYRSACAALERAGQRKKLAENRIRARLGNGHRALDPSGQPVARRDVYDVKAHTRKASHVDRLVAVKPPAPKEQP